MLLLRFISCRPLNDENARGRGRVTIAENVAIVDDGGKVCCFNSGAEVELMITDTTHCW